MSSGPFMVVGPDGAQLEALMGSAAPVMEGWTMERLNRTDGALAPRHVYFLLLPSHIPFSSLRVDFTGVPLLSLSERTDLPRDAESFFLGSTGAATVLPLLRALAHRQCDYCRDRRAYDQAAAEISQALIAEAADLQRVLAALGSVLVTGRVTLFELGRDGFNAAAVQEWCAAPGDSLIKVQPVIDRRTLLWLWPQLELTRLVCIDDVAALPFTAIEERVMANVRNARAVLIAPVRSPHGGLRGAILAEQTGSPRPWTGQGERLLLMAGEMLANYLERRSARAEVQEGEAVHDQVLEHIHDGVFMAAADGSGVSFVSPPAARMWGMPAEELAAGPDNWQRVVHPEDLQRVRERVRAKRESRGSPEDALEFRILRADDGCERWIRARTFPVRNVDGRVERIAGLLEDITEQREQQTRLRLLARVFETTGEAVVLTDPDSRIIDVNPAFTRITGYTREEVLGQNPRIMSSGRHGPGFYAQMWQALLVHHHWRGEIWDRRKDGSEYPKLLTINAITEPDGTVSSYVGVFADITDVKETEARLARMAHHDALTGLPNRVLFRDRLEQAMAQAVRGGHLLCVMFVDLDGFKGINDRLGHRAGDQLLVEVAMRLREQVRESDTVARIGGDEFTAILPQLSDRGGARAVAQKFLSTLAQPFRIMGSEVRISASIGISLFPDHVSDVEGLVRSADRAMYQAKAAGRNQLCFFGEWA